MEYPRVDVKGGIAICEHGIPILVREDGPWLTTCLECTRRIQAVGKGRQKMNSIEVDRIIRATLPRGWKVEVRPSPMMDAERFRVVVVAMCSLSLDIEEDATEAEVMAHADRIRSELANLLRREADALDCRASSAQELISD